jgi:hypothetical protein
LIFYRLHPRTKRVVFVIFGTIPILLIFAAIGIRNIMRIAALCTTVKKETPKGDELRKAGKQENVNSTFLASLLSRSPRLLRQSN